MCYDCNVIMHDQWYYGGLAQAHSREYCSAQSSTSSDVGSRGCILLEGVKLVQRIVVVCGANESRTNSGCGHVHGTYPGWIYTWQAARFSQVQSCSMWLRVLIDYRESRFFEQYQRRSVSQLMPIFFAVLNQAVSNRWVLGVHMCIDISISLFLWFDVCVRCQLEPNSCS